VQPKYDEPAPSVLNRFIEVGIVQYAGVTYAATPARVKGLSGLSVGLSDRSHAKLIEDLLWHHGWMARHRVQWSTDRSGSIHFILRDEAASWRAAGF